MALGTRREIITSALVSVALVVAVIAVGLVASETLRAQATGATSIGARDAGSVQVVQSRAPGADEQAAAGSSRPSSSASSPSFSASTRRASRKASVGAGAAAAAAARSAAPARAGERAGRVGADSTPKGSAVGSDGSIGAGGSGDTTATVPAGAPRPAPGAQLPATVARRHIGLTVASLDLVGDELLTRIELRDQTGLPPAGSLPGNVELRVRPGTAMAAGMREMEAGAPDVPAVRLKVDLVGDASANGAAASTRVRLRLGPEPSPEPDFTTAHDPGTGDALSNVVELTVPVQPAAAEAEHPDGARPPAHRPPARATPPAPEAEFELPLIGTAAAVGDLVTLHLRVGDEASVAPERPVDVEVGVSVRASVPSSEGDGRV